MKRQTFNDINITPLTDIFLVLLIIMMVIAPILDQQGLSLAVPEFVDEKQANNDTKLLTVQVTENNEYIINSKIVNQDELKDVINSQKELFPDGLLIQASGNSSHQNVVKLMDEARNVGVKSISIVEM